jgi:transcriptional regulator NrdR family protein
MKCPLCNGGTELLETRKRAAGTYRRYECGKFHRFSTLNNELQRVDEKKRSAGRPRQSNA